MITKPSWLPEETRKQDKTFQSGAKFQSASSVDKNKKEKSKLNINTEQDPRLKLPNGVKFGMLYSKENRDGFGKVVKNNLGCIICHRYHLKGICDSGFRFIESHIPLLEEEVTKLAEYKKFAQDNFDKGKNEKDPDKRGKDGKF